MKTTYVAIGIPTIFITCNGTDIMAVNPEFIEAINYIGNEINLCLNKFNGCIDGISSSLSSISN